MHESIIIVLPLPPAWPKRLQYDCNTIAPYATSFRPPVFTLYITHYCALQYLVKAKHRRKPTAVADRSDGYVAVAELSKKVAVTAP